MNRIMAIVGTRVGGWLCTPATILIAVGVGACATAGSGPEDTAQDRPPSREQVVAVNAAEDRARERDEFLADEENQRRVATLQAYAIGELTEAGFWGDQWNARDPLYGKLGVVGFVREVPPTSNNTYVLGVVSQLALTFSQEHASATHGSFLWTVAADRQQLLERVLAGKGTGGDMLPAPLRYQVVESERGITWTPSEHDRSFYEVAFVNGVLASVREAR